MNYKKHYDRLISRAQERTLLPDIYFEKHHIVPRCLNGSDDPLNIVRLLPEEHYVAHQLLVKIYPENSKIILAARMMTINPAAVRRNNKEYKWLKERFVKSITGVARTDETKKKISESKKLTPMSAELRAHISAVHTGLHHSEQTKRKISIAGKGRIVSAETKAKLSLLNKGKPGHPQSAETRLKISQNGKGMSGKQHSEEAKRKMSESISKIPPIICPNCNKIGKSSVMYRWHFNNCRNYS